MMISLSVMALISMIGNIQARIMHGTIRGWNSWCAVGLEGNESLMHQAADFLSSSGLKQQGYSWIVNDAGFYGAGAPIDPMTVSIDEYGRLIPSEARYPSGGGSFLPISNALKQKGYKFGHWLIRGIPIRSVKEKKPIKGTKYTAADIARFDRNCPWSNLTVGVNASHPASQAWYDSVVELAAESGVALLKWDCLFGSNLVRDELELIANAVRRSPADIVLSLSPGHDETPTMGQWVNDNDIATFFRVDGDFWDGGPQTGADQLWTHLQTAWANARAGVRNNDLDMLPLGAIGCGSANPPCRQSRFSLQQQRTIMAVWGITGSPLLWGGVPSVSAANATTLGLLGNKRILEMHEAAAAGEGGLPVRGAGSAGPTARYELLAVQVQGGVAVGVEDEEEGLAAARVRAGPGNNSAAFTLRPATGASHDGASSLPAWVTVTSHQPRLQFRASWTDLGIDIPASGCAEVTDLWTGSTDRRCGGLDGALGFEASAAWRVQPEVATG